MDVTLVQGDITAQTVDAIVNAANSSLMGGGGVIHTVGPVYSRTDDRSKVLASCYHESLRAADSLGARSVALPAISTGIYGWPLDDGARIALRTVREVSTAADEVRFVLFDVVAYAAFSAAL